MKKVAVILPVNNPEMLTAEDLKRYATEGCQLSLYIAQTALNQLNSADEVALIIEPVVNAAKQAQQEGAEAIVVFAFGDVAIEEIRAVVSVPVMGLGKLAAHVASVVCRERFTIIPGQLEHNAFIGALIEEEGLSGKFVLARSTVGIDPADLRSHPQTFSKLVQAVVSEIQSQNVDTFTMGCGCFIGLAKPLETELRKRGHQQVTVVDPFEVPIKIAMSLV